MVFNSLTFVVFFACVLALHSLPLPWTIRKINLLLASYLFYAAWNPPFVILLWISTVVDWYAAQGLVKATRHAARHAWMLLSVVANLGMLVYFKYGQFLLDSFSALMSAVGSRLPPGALRHRAAGGHLVLYLRHHVLHAGRVPAARRAGAEPARLRAVRHLLPAPGGRADHAPDRTRAAVCRAAPCQRAAAALRAGTDDGRPLQQGRAR